MGARTRDAGYGIDT